jgi:hypothetical protein
MSAEDAFQTLKTFFESRQAAKQAMSVVQEGAEIGIVIGGIVECALFRQEDQTVVERRPANNPDLVFHIRPESIYILSGRTKDEIGDIGVNVLKEILAGNISVKIPGRLMNLVTRGYLDMLRKGGAPVTAFLTRHGFTGISKILGTIKQMKR